MLLDSKNQTANSTNVVFANCLTESAFYSIDLLSDYALEDQQNVEILLNEGVEDAPSIDCLVSFNTPTRTESRADAIEVEITTARLNEGTEVTLTNLEQINLENEIAELIAKHI